MKEKHKTKHRKVIGFIVTLFILWIGCEKLMDRVQVENVKSGSVHFDDYGINITKKLSTEDLETIKGIFNGKILYRDEPSCGFAEDSSISLDDGAELYYISYDTCPVVYDKNRNRYFRISEKDNDTMRSMLREYGCLVNY